MIHFYGMYSLLARCACKEPATRKFCRTGGKGALDGVFAAMFEVVVFTHVCEDLVDVEDYLAGGWEEHGL